MRRAAALSVAGGTAACAYAYNEARKSMGDDALARIVSYDTVALPAILEYKWVEAKCERLPKMMPCAWSSFKPVPLAPTLFLAGRLAARG